MTARTRLDVTLYVHCLVETAKILLINPYQHRMLQINMNFTHEIQLLV